MTTTSRRRPTLVTRTQPKETSGTASPLWRGDGRAVPRDDLRLVRKDLATGGVHTHLQAFRLLLHLAEAGDPTDDVTALRPEGRAVIELGHPGVTGISPTKFVRKSPGFARSDSRPTKFQTSPSKIRRSSCW